MTPRPSYSSTCLCGHLPTPHRACVVMPDGPWPNRAGPSGSLAQPAPRCMPCAGNGSAARRGPDILLQALNQKTFPGAASSGVLVHVIPYSVKCAGLDSSLINCLSRPRASSQSGALWRPPPPAPVPLCPCPAWSGPAGSDRTLVSARILVLSSIHLGHHDSFFSGSVYHGWCKAHHEALRAGRFAP